MQVNVLNMSLNNSCFNGLKNFISPKIQAQTQFGLFLRNLFQKIDIDIKLIFTIKFLTNKKESHM